MTTAGGRKTRRRIFLKLASPTSPSSAGASLRCSSISPRRARERRQRSRSRTPSAVVPAPRGRLCAPLGAFAECGKLVASRRIPAVLRRDPTWTLHTVATETPRTMPTARRRPPVPFRAKLSRRLCRRASSTAPVSATPDREGYERSRDARLRARGTRKTVLLSAWGELCDGAAVAWLALDRDDNRSRRFWLGVERALDRAGAFDGAPATDGTVGGCGSGSVRRSASRSCSSSTTTTRSRAPSSCASSRPLDRAPRGLRARAVDAGRIRGSASSASA